MPERGFAASKPMKNPRNYFTKNQLNALLNACKRERDRLLLWVLIMTGRRISEVLGGSWYSGETLKTCPGLRPKDIDFGEGLINWHILKKKEPTTLLLPVDSVTLNHLKNYVRKNSIGEGERIFPITRQRADQIIKKVAKEAGIVSVGSNLPHLHAIRHSFLIEGAKKAERPEDLVMLKEMAGHSDINITMYYLKYSPKKQRNLLGRMWKR